MLGGLDFPTEGSVKVGNKELSRMNDEKLAAFRRRNIGFVFQQFNLIQTLNVRENIVLPIQLDGGRIDETYFQEIVSLLKIEEKLTQLPNQLSGGQQQRVAIARALASEAPVILADEPTGNLDEDTAMSIMQILEDSVYQMNKCAIIVTHSQEIAKRADVIFHLKRGTLQKIENN